MGGGAVVLLQPDHPRAGKILFEFQNVADLSPPPAIDRLIVVADAANIAVRLGEQAQPEVLGDVGVLIFVHQNIAEPALIAFQHIGVVLKDLQDMQQQVAEIAGVQHLKPRLIFGIQLRPHAAIGACVGGGHAVRCDRFVLPAVNDGGELTGGPAFVVDVMGLHDLLHQAKLIVAVQNGEVRLQFHQFGVPPKDFHRQRMEGAKPGHPLDRMADQPADPRLHLARGLVGEGDGQNLIRAGAARRQQMRDPAGQRLGLARPGAGQHQDRAVQCLHRLPLGRVQPVEIGRRRRRAREVGELLALPRFESVIECRVVHGARQ